MECVDFVVSYRNESIITEVVSSFGKSKGRFPWCSASQFLLPQGQQFTGNRHLTPTNNNIRAKLTNQLIQTGLSTFDWQQPFTWVWWWLPFRLSKNQSPLPTTVLLRTTLTQTIKPHYDMLPHGLKPFLILLGKISKKSHTSLIGSTDERSKVANQIKWTNFQLVEVVKLA